MLKHKTPLVIGGVAIFTLLVISGNVILGSFAGSLQNAGFAQLVASTNEAKPKTDLPKPTPTTPPSLKLPAPQVLLKNAALEQLPKLIDYAGSKVPEDLVNLYKGTELKQTLKSSSEDLAKMVVAGNLSNTEFEAALRDVFGTATTDTATFANGLMDKYNLKNIAVTLANDPTNTKAITDAIKQEVQDYAKEEINKLANQAIGKMFPVLEGVEIDFTKLDAKSLKSSMRSMVINAMAQSYLGPEYVAVYMVVSTVCPKCMVAAHAELRRFDKNYLQPATGKIADEWDRFEDRLKASSAKFGQQISAEIARLKDRVAAELKRQKQQVELEARRNEVRFQEQLKRAQDSRVGQEVERQLNDIADASTVVVTRAQAEAQREFDDVSKEATRLGKRAEAEVKRQISDVKTELKTVTAKAKTALMQNVKSVANQAQKAKEKVEAELKRAAEKVQAELNRAKETVKKWGKKLKCC